MAGALGFVLVAMAVISPMVYSNLDGDALISFRKSLLDPDNVLQSWDPALVNPCTWFYITCNEDNRVTRVDLGNKKLSGHLVPELGQLEQLQYLEVFKNNLQGTIPAELGNLKSLISLDLGNNNLSGTIPSSLGNLKSLVFFLINLDLGNNNISGTIPPSLGKLKSLAFLRLHDNHLSGQIPRELISLPNLQVVDLSNNNFCGKIPTSGPFEHIPLNNFENNPRLDGPELLGIAQDDTNC